jgi:hypothetical protein
MKRVPIDVIKLTLLNNDFRAADKINGKIFETEKFIKHRKFKSLMQEPVDFQIVGTDISDRALARAKSASYTQLEIQRGLSAPLMVKYFKKNEQDQSVIYQKKSSLTKAA